MPPCDGIGISGVSSSLWGGAGAGAVVPTPEPFHGWVGRLVLAVVVDGFGAVGFCSCAAVLSSLRSWFLLARIMSCSPLSFRSVSRSRVEGVKGERSRGLGG